MNFKGRCFVFEEKAIYIFFNSSKKLSFLFFFFLCLNEIHLKAFQLLGEIRHFHHGMNLEPLEGLFCYFSGNFPRRLIIYAEKKCCGVCHNKGKNIILFVWVFLLELRETYFCHWISIRVIVISSGSSENYFSRIGCWSSNLTPLQSASIFASRIYYLRIPNRSCFTEIFNLPGVCWNMGYEKSKHNLLKNMLSFAYFILKWLIYENIRRLEG